MMDPLSGIPSSVHVHPYAKELLRKAPAEVRALLVGLLEVMERSAQKRSIPVAKTELTTERDPEEGTEKIEIHQWVGVPHDAAMDYWEEMSRDVDEWANALPEPAFDQLGEWLAFTVYPEVNDAAA